MSHTALQDIEKLEATLWETADNLRANSHKSCAALVAARDLLLPRLMSGEETS